ncbi:MAG: sulfatase-like hydrolase/transferase [Sandaracinaceae bacterium]|nr:sulfatase-like hydrolase/transferase [Sandaracinaceae bacterium]
MIDRRALLLLAAGLCACGSSSDTPPATATPTEGTTTPEEGETAPPATTESPSGEGDHATTTTPSAPRGTPRVRYALARHVPRAELRQDDTLVLDMGVPGAAKYTIGGWRTRVGASVHERPAGQPEASASVIENVTGFVIVPSDAPGPRTLRMRARALGDGRLTVYVDGETVGLARLPTDGTYGVVEITIPAERLHVGENMVQLRIPQTGVLPRPASEGGAISNAGVLIDWIRLGPATDPHASEQPPSPETLATVDGSHARLSIPDGWTLGYTMEIPDGARLRGVAEGEGHVEVLALRDGHEPTSVGRIAAGSFDLDLDALAGSIARLDLRASGELRLTDPTVVTLDGRPTATRPTIRNVLVYLTDTLRADKLHPYRPESRVRTPNFDSWAHGAAVMMRGHGQENWTKPSVATLLSGLFPWEHHATTEDAVLPADVQLLSERLGREFHSGAFIANGFCSDRFGFRQGWDTFRNYVREGERNQAQFVAADVLSWLDERPQDEPFFLYVHTVDPHVPYLPPEEMLALYDPNPYDGPVDFNRDRELLEHVKSGSLQVNERDREHLEALYDGEITYHDVHFGSIMEGLERRGLAESTIVVFTADHGEEFFDHGSVGHGHSVYEELINVPLVVRVPGVTDEGVRLDDSVGLVDVLPTIYDALGRPIPDDLSGESFLPLLLGQTADAPRVAVTGFMEGWRAVNVGRLKLIQRTERRVMLHDLVEDPDELTDVSADRPIAVRYARGLLGLHLAGVERPSRQRAAIREEHLQIDAETRRQLEELGYAGASRAGVAQPH